MDTASIITYARTVPQSNTRSDDSIVDRLHHHYTIAMLVIFSILVGAKQLLEEQIVCWVPDYFKKERQPYVDSYCWAKNTYYLPFEEYIPKPDEHEKRKMITYYQWVPLILLVQALAFSIPCMIWRTFTNRSGVDLNGMIEAGQTFQSLEESEEKDETLERMTSQMERYLGSKREHGHEWTVSVKNCISRVCCVVCGRKRGNYLVTLYLTVKIFYIANVILQLFALNVFLGSNFNFYGIDVIRDIVNGLDWKESQRFPRVTMCDYNIRRLGNVHRYTVQCVLPINLFNEYVYLLVWFWFVFVSIMTCISFLVWLLRIAMKSDQIRYITKHLTLHKKITIPTDEDKVKDFVNDILRQDGVFILRLVDHNTNAITATELVCALWDVYNKKDKVEDKDKEKDKDKDN